MIQISNKREHIDISILDKINKNLMSELLFLYIASLQHYTDHYYKKLQLCIQMYIQLVICYISKCIYVVYIVFLCLYTVTGSCVCGMSFQCASNTTSTSRHRRDTTSEVKGTLNPTQQLQYIK